MTYPNLTWSLISNEQLKTILFETYQDKPRYLLKLDKLIFDLKNSKCENIQQKMKEVNVDLDKFESIISELETARFLTRSGMKVELLSDNYFGGRQSPDILYKYDNLESYIEVTRVGELKSISGLFDYIRILVNDLPYRVDMELKNDLSLPRLDGKERDIQDELVKVSLKAFENILKSKYFTEFPVIIETDGIIFKIYLTISGKGYPGVINSEVIKVPVDNLIGYIKSKILIKKAKKRDDFRDEHRMLFYVIALDSKESSIDELDIDKLLYGQTHGLGENILGFPKEKYERWKQNEWNIIISRVMNKPTWQQIEQAKANGWESFLIDKYLIPNNYANRTEDGIFLSEPDLKNVSGVLFKNKWNEIYTFYPNPFCHSEINSPDIQKIFSFD